jgi:hypothetical protein
MQETDYSVPDIEMICESVAKCFPLFQLPSSHVSLSSSANYTTLNHVNDIISPQCLLVSSATSEGECKWWPIITCSCGLVDVIGSSYRPTRSGSSATAVFCLLNWTVGFGVLYIVDTGCVRSEAFKAVTMNSAVFWDIKTQFVHLSRHITSLPHSLAS